MDIKKLKAVAEKASPNLSVNVSWVDNSFGPDEIVVKSNVEYKHDRLVGEINRYPESDQAILDAEFINTFNPTLVKQLLEGQYNIVPMQAPSQFNPTTNILAELSAIRANSELNPSQTKLLNFIMQHIKDKYAK